MATLFMTLGDFSKDLPEIDEEANPGEAGYCASAASDVASHNRLCTIIRGIDRLVVSRTDGSVVLLEAFEELGPLLADLLRYIDGSLIPGEEEKYGDLQIVRRMVNRCDEEAMVALLSGTLDLIRPPRGQHLLGDLLSLLENEDLREFLFSLEVQGETGKRGVLALLRIAFTQLIREDYHPYELEELLDTLVYPFIRSAFPESNLEGDLRSFVGHLVEALNPEREPEILQHLQGVVACGMVVDSEERLLSAIYDLTVHAGPTGFDDLIATSILLLDYDIEGEIILATDLILRSLTDDRDFVYALERLLWVFLDEPNARIILPVLIDALEKNVFAELVALMDQLLGACRGAPSSGE